MTLKEKLAALGLSETDTKEINSLVDLVIEGKVKAKDEEINKLNGDIKSMGDELTPLKSEKRKSHISSLVGDITSKDKIADAIALSGITEEDDDETIKSKVSKTINERTYLQKDNGIPGEIIKTEKEKIPEKTKEYRFMENEEDN